MLRPALSGLLPVFLCCVCLVQCRDNAKTRISIGQTLYSLPGHGPVDRIPFESGEVEQGSLPLRPPLEGRITPGQLFGFTVYAPIQLDEEQLGQLRTPALFFPGLGENFAIYINGYEIDRKIFVSGGKLDRRRTELAYSLPFPGEYLRPGSNLLVIYLLGEVSGGSDPPSVPGLFYDGGYFVADVREAQAARHNLADLILISLYLASGFYFLFIFLRRRQELYGFYFFLFTLGTFGFYFFRTGIAYDLATDTEALTRWENGSIFLLPGVLVLFTYSYLRPHVKLPLWAYIIAGLNLMFSLLAVLGPFEMIRVLVEYWRLLQVPLLIWLPVFHVYCWRKRYRDAGKVLMALLALLASATFDLANNIYSFVSMEPTFRWGFFGFVAMLVGTMVNRFVVSLDQSEKLNADLRAAQLELEEAGRMRDTFVAAASHEIRTPIHGILGISRLLLMERQSGIGPLSPALRNSLELIRESAVRLSRLVEDFVDHSRLKEGQLQIHQSAVYLFPAVEYAISSLQPQTREKRLEFLNEVPNDLPPLFADELRLQQILLNLLSNAVKFTREGRVTVRARSMESTVEVSILDTGIGIPPDRLEAIFKPFQQADASVARSYGGTGLGLFIVKQLIELHGGAIQAESRPGRGTEFRFELPLYTGTEQAPKSELSSGMALREFQLLQAVTRDSAARFEDFGEKPTVLVVDDETVNAAVLRGILEPAGLHVLTRRSGRAAIDYLQSGGKADVAVLDFMLGGMSGIELCQWIRQGYSQVDLPVLILTAHGDSDRMVEGFSAGANDYLEKPLDPVELLARIRTLVDLRFSSLEKSELLNYRQELQIARKIHRELLPGEMPAIDGLKIVADYRPRGDLGGDYYDVQVTRDGVAMLLADVTGHGIAAALGAAITRVAFLLQREVWHEPSSVLEGMNRILLDAGTSQLVTGVCARLDIQAGRLHFARAGHLAAVLLRGDGGSEILFPRGRVMGWVRNLECQPYETPFGPGDRLVLFTDGLVENRNREGEFLGEERILRFLESNSSLGAEELLESLISFLEQWSSEPEDDIALLILEDTRNRSNAPGSVSAEVLESGRRRQATDP